jgi:uncharacterized protein YdiU (UPF0061 family)
MTPHFPFDNSYARLPERFYTRTPPTPVRDPHLIKLNHALAADLGLDANALDSDIGASIFSGNILPEGAASIATAYAGHQFGGFTPKLGDGRAILLGEVVDRNGQRKDIQLKGAGRTPWSRGGDGRAVLGPVLREYIISEAMYALGIPTTRALAAVTTGERVFREEMLPGAIFTRVASSHIRIGTFQYFAARGDNEAVRTLTDYALQRHYPHLEGSSPYPARALLDAVVDAQAKLVAQWLLVGFIHGVMNTDNTSVAGETIDYGPCAFMDEYNPDQVFSSIDREGRYAYSMQPAVAQWNLTRLAECLIPIMGETQEDAVAYANESLTVFAPKFEAAYETGLLRKIGIENRRDGDMEIVAAFLYELAANAVDFTNAFRTLGNAVTNDPAAVATFRTLFKETPQFDAWLESWRGRLNDEMNTVEERRENMRAANPAFIPRNHRVEAVIRAAVDSQDFEPFETLLAILSQPFDDQPHNASYMKPPEEGERVYRTFCGT